MTSAFLPQFAAASAATNSDTLPTSFDTYNVADSLIDPSFADSRLAMSFHRPGDVAPLPSPTARNAPADHYFAPFGMTAEQLQDQSSQQQQAFLQAQQQISSQHAQQYTTQQHQELLLQQQQQQQGQFLQEGQVQFQPHPQSQDQYPTGQLHPPQHPTIQMTQPPDPSRLAPEHAYQQQQQSQHQYVGQHQGRQMSQSSTDSEASLHLRDFSLVAEAAKRAQIAVVTRDLEDVSL